MSDLNYHARARLASLLDTLADKIERERKSTKSVNEVLRAYRDTIENLVVDAANGHIRVARMTTLMSRAIYDSALAVYAEGMKQGGIAFDELDEDERADEETRISEWESTQQESARSFIRDAVAVSSLKGDERTQARDALLARVDLWVFSLEALGGLAYARALGDPVLTFSGSDGAESCAECQRYKGKSHRLSWWESRGLTARNGNDNFTCGRWKPCDHHFYDKNGRLIIV
jgi:hypothetical protein